MEKSFRFHYAADQVDIARFNASGGNGMGPNFVEPGQLCFDMKNGPSSAWNNVINQHLLLRILAKPNLPQPPISPAMWLKLLKQKFGGCQSRWREGQRKILADGRLETNEEVDVRLGILDAKNSKKGRSDSRRNSVRDIRCCSILVR